MSWWFDLSVDAASVAVARGEPAFPALYVFIGRFVSNSLSLTGRNSLPRSLFSGFSVATCVSLVRIHGGSALPTSVVGVDSPGDS